MKREEIIKKIDDLFYVDFYYPSDSKQFLSAVYDEVIAPLLKERCENCVEKNKGG